MEIGRLLRDEGITPDMIRQNRELLVNVMKTTLKNEASLAESMPQSYATAPEYPVDNDTTSSFTRSRNLSHQCLPSVLSPLGLLGSAPPRDSVFTDSFFNKHNGVTSSLDQKHNVDDGMQSLLQGMDRQEFNGRLKQDDDDYLESEDAELKEISFHRNDSLEHREFSKCGGLAALLREPSCDASQELSNHSTVQTLSSPEPEHCVLDGSLGSRPLEKAGGERSS